MSLSTNQHLTVFVSQETAAQGAAAATIGETLAVALGTAGASTGQITYQSSNGLCYSTAELAKAGAIDATPANDTGDGTYSIVYRALDDNIYRRKVEGALSEEVNKPYSAHVPKEATLTIPGAGVVGEEYVLRVALPNYGGMISQQDEKYFYGSHVNVAGDTATTIAAGLVSSLNKAMASVPVPVITASNALGVITIVGIKQPWVRAKFEGKPVYFHVSLTSPDNLLLGETITVPLEVGAGVDSQVLTMEEFFAGYNSDYANRDADYPANGNPTFAAEVGGTYNSSSWVLAKIKQGASMLSQRQEILCFFKQ